MKEMYGKKVINEKVMEKWSFYFYYCVQKFSVYNFLGELFCYDFNIFDLIPMFL